MLLKKARLVALGLALFALPAVAVACGDDDDDDVVVETPTVSVETPVETAETPLETPTATETEEAETATPDGDGDAESEVEQALQEISEAELQGDAEAFLNRFTENAIQNLFGASSREEALELFGPEFEPSEEPTFGDPSNIEVSGDTATAELEASEGSQVANGTQINLVLEEGVWRVDSFGPLAAEIPEDATVVTLGLQEFAFVFDAAQVADGNFAFDVTNTGDQVHEISISRVPEDLDIQAALQSEEEPEGVEDVGYIGPIEPGATTNVVFTEPLDPGRYVLLCFVGDSEGDGAPHALLGMWAEFTVE